MCGNGFTLITIRMTPRLWTKTNVIMTSMLLSYFLASFSLICFNSYTLLADAQYKGSCHFNVVISGLTILAKVPAYVSALNTILVSVERYVAIVHPLYYETTFTDRTLKLAISAVWVMGILMGMTFALWQINADLRKCTVPVHYQLLDVVIFILVCICLISCYGKILAISWHHHRRIEPQLANANHAPGSSLQTTAVTTVTHNNRATTGHNTEDSNDKSLTGIGAPSGPSVSSGAASLELTQEQRWQKIKSRRREFKAAYLIAAIVGTWTILTIPRMIGRIMESAGYNPVVTGYIMKVSGAMATLKFALSWAVYVVMSKSYRRAYRQMLIRIGCCCCCKNVMLPADNSLVV